MPGNIVQFRALLRAFSRMHHDCLRQTFNKQGFAELSNPKVLFFLRHMEGQPMSQKEIADHLGVAPATIAISLKRMEKVGLVQKSADASDLRRNCVTLTEKGKILTEQCENADDAAIAPIIKGFTQQEIDLMCAFYRRMIQNMEELGVKAPAELRIEVNDR